ncbi:MAG TPA: hypothetical protein VK249_19005, partial [Anaerolineales bacterium]|nr:hypothetical protein [Anaerolineales bacterium]
YAILTPTYGGGLHAKSRFFSKLFLRYSFAHLSLILRSALGDKNTPQMWHMYIPLPNWRETGFFNEATTALQRSVSEGYLPRWSANARLAL